jgi:myo-inositol-1(or 4)-monophosphatase
VLPTLANLEDLAHQAGAILRAGFPVRPGFDGIPQVEYKDTINPVTEFDRRTEAFLIDQVRGCCPEARIVAEESGDSGGNNALAWYIDPLDGTVNYSHGVPIFTVSIAFAVDERVQLGVVYDPMRDECFSAERGKGAWLDGKPIRASSTPDLDHSLLVTGFAYDIRTNPVNNLDEYARFSLCSQSVRRLGSAAMDLCYVAAGRLDGYWELYIEPYDIAAGGLIAEEGGAVVSSVQGDRDYLRPPCSILAANPHIYPVMMELLNN